MSIFPSFFPPFSPYYSCFCSILFFNYVSPLSIRAGNISKTFVDNTIWNARKYWNFLAFDFSWTWFYALGSQKAGTVLPVKGDREYSPLGNDPEEWIMGQICSLTNTSWKGEGKISLSFNYHNQLGRIKSSDRWLWQSFHLAVCKVCTRLVESDPPEGCCQYNFPQPVSFAAT